MRRLGMFMMVIVGFVAGIAFVYSCGGSSSSAATTVTEYLSLNGAAFQPKYSGYADYAIGSDGIWNNDGSSDSWEAPVILPNNATINWVKVYWEDDDAGANLTFQLRTYIPSETLVDTIALATSNGSAGMGSTVDDTIDEPIVDNINGTYTLLLTIPTSDIVFRMAVIEYEYTI